MDIVTANEIFNEQDSIEGVHECAYLNSLQLIDDWKSEHMVGDLRFSIIAGAA